MRELAGVAAAAGVAVGPVAVMGAAVPPPTEEPATGPVDAELACLRVALASVAGELRRRGAQAGGAARDVLEAQALMAADPVLGAEAETRVRGGATAARATYDAFSAYRDALVGAGGYLGARVTDLDDVRDRVVAACLGVAPPGVPEPGHPFVLVARDLAPADTVTLDLDQVLALVTEEGGPTGHTAILARERGLPAVVGCTGALGLPDGTVVAVDGERGTVTVEPPPAAIGAQRRPAPLAGPVRMSDGRRVTLLANVGDAAGARAAAAAGAEGIGLLRTEFCFAGTIRPPAVAEQRTAYAAILAPFAGRRAVVRVLDAGADKPLPYLTDATEPNPALGVRGLRALQRAPEVLDSQLAALRLAAEETGADVEVMAPMVADAADARWWAARARAAGFTRVGVMVEVPSAALGAEAVLAEVDFASVGTNDLTQYTVAADRGLGALAARQDPWQPAVLRLVAMTAAAGVAAGKPVGVCGEAAADPLLALVLLGMGVSSLSMAAGSLSAVARSLAAPSYDDCRRLAEQALEATDAEAARAAVRAGVAG